MTIGNEATINGLELTVEAQPLPQLSVGAYIDIKNGKWDRYLNSGSSRYGSNGVRSLTGDAVSFDGNKLARVPDMTMSVNGTWRFGAVSGWAPSLRADLTYYGKYYETDFNFTKVWRIMIVISSILVLIGVGSLATRWLNLSIDFRGGGRVCCHCFCRHHCCALLALPKGASGA